MTTVNGVSHAGDIPDARPTTALARTHIGALDGIRGIAILLVLVFHYGNNIMAEGLLYHRFTFLHASIFGWTGVDLFFVLSGFLITGILYDSRNAPNYFRNFYMRRVLRIFPLYYAALALVVLLSVLWPSAGLWGDRSPLWVALYLTNIALIAYGDASVGILAHFWSLAIEEHFYLVWPLFVLLGTRRQLMVAAALLSAMALSLRIAFAFWDLNPEVAYFLTPARMDALAIGAFCSLACRGEGGVARILRPAACVAVACGIAILLIILVRQTFRPNDVVMSTVGFTLIGLFSGGMIITSIGWRPLNGVMSNALLRWFGRYSYGLYVWHPIVNLIMLTPAVRGALDTNLFRGSYIVLMFATVLLVSVTSFKFLERPFLKLKHRFD